MIDEFTDVNEGEKALMKMWNLHVMDKEWVLKYELVFLTIEKIVINGYFNFFVIHNQLLLCYWILLGAVMR